LLDSIPATYLERQAPDDRWSARNHLQHLATIDDLVLPLVQQAGAGNAVLWLAGPEPGDLERQRTAATDSVARASTDELRARMLVSREAVAGAVSRLPQLALERLVLTAGTEDGWSTPTEWSLRTYLAGWAEHDTVHEVAIRRAITAPPDLATVALMRRRT
jgi:hypothetical protein